MARKTAARAKQKAAPKKPRRKAAEKPVPENARLGGKPYPIVGVGASAGGFEAFKELLQALPADTGMAFVLVQHLDPEHESMLSKLLSRTTAMPVSEVREGMAVEPNRVYVIPPNSTMGIAGGVLHVTRRGDRRTRHMPIDSFLRSLAEDQGSRAIGVILSGTASDGTIGLKAIKAEGGITFAQDKASAKYDGMPSSAVAAACVDFVLPPGSIARELARIGRHPYLGVERPAPEAGARMENDDDLRRVFGVIEEATGVDFTHYKYSTIKRRIARRMVLHKLEDLRQYLGLLQKDPAEPAALCEDILIHVTGFFREPESFKALAEWVVPSILESKPRGEAFRVWVPGCSTGEEAYSFAMVILECLNHRVSRTPVQIFGTDLSGAAIETARAGVYSESSLAEVSPERLRRFFLKVEGGFQINKSVREMCIFARQDLAKDPPFSRMDLISCRNVLIYMGPVLQKRVMTMLHYALRPAGYLLLGRSESVDGFSDLFTLADRQNRICAKRTAAASPALELAGTLSLEREPAETGRKPDTPARFDVLKEADRVILGQYSPPGLVVNDNLQILHFRGQCSPYLGPAPGEASLNLLRMVRPEFTVEMRTAIHQARKQEVAVRKAGIRIRRNGRDWDAGLEVVPLKGDQGERFFLVLFDHAAAPERVEPKPGQRSPAAPEAQGRELSLLKRELHTTKEYLQSIIEEQEATNEELKASNEEALSSNEELQSTNEELETAKEELQSTNEELVTVNEQLQTRNAELAQMTDDLTNLLGGISIPILILDKDRRIRRFNRQAEKLLDLHPEDLGRLLDHIRPALELPGLDEMIAAAMNTSSLREREIRDRDGRWHILRVQPCHSLGNKIDGAILLFVDVDALKTGQIELEQEQRFTAAVLDSAGAPVMVTDPEGRISRFNRACQQISGRSFEEVKGKAVWDVLLAPEDVSAARAVYRELVESRAIRVHESRWVDRQGRRRLLAWCSTVIPEQGDAVRHVIRIGTDITEQRQAEEALRQSDAALLEKQNQLRALTASLLEAQETERRRMSRELHDDVNQRLAALAIDVELLRQHPPAQDSELQAKLERFRQRLETLAEDLRRTAHHLHPFALTQLGLGPALRSFCEEFSEQRGIKVRLTVRELPGSMPEDVALCLYRVVQEALNNIAKHSSARKAAIFLSGSDGSLKLAVRDDGRGFDLTGPRGKGLGLTSLEERVRAVGGRLSLSSMPGNGTRLEVRIPVAAEAAG